MHVNDISRQQFSKIAPRGFQGRLTLTGHGLVLGAGTLLAKLDDKARPIAADQERIWTLLAVAYGHEVPLAVFGSLRRAAKHWHRGDKHSAARCGAWAHAKLARPRHVPQARSAPEAEY